MSHFKEAVVILVVAGFILTIEREISTGVVSVTFAAKKKTEKQSAAARKREARRALMATEARAARIAADHAAAADAPQAAPFTVAAVFVVPWPLEEEHMTATLVPGAAPGAGEARGADVGSRSPDGAGIAVTSYLPPWVQGNARHADAAALRTAAASKAKVKVTWNAKPRTAAPDATDARPRQVARKAKPTTYARAIYGTTATSSRGMLGDDWARNWSPRSR